MDVLAELNRIATEQPGDFHPMVLMGLAIVEEDGKEIVTIRTVANEVLLRAVLDLPRLGRQWLHDALDRLCDGTLPPDDQPKDAVIKHFTLDGRST